MRGVYTGLALQRAGAVNHCGTTKFLFITSTETCDETVPLDSR
jgi:hypothetical protein